MHSNLPIPLSLAAVHLGRYDTICQAVANMVGYEARELTEDSSFWIDDVHPEDRQRILTELPRLERGVCTHEYRFQHKDGTCRWMRDEMRLITEWLKCLI